MDYQIVCRGPEIVWIRDNNNEVVFTSKEDINDLKQALLEDHLYRALKYGEGTIDHLLQKIPKIEEELEKMKVIRVSENFLTLI